MQEQPTTYADMEVFAEVGEGGGGSQRLYTPEKKGACGVEIVACVVGGIYILQEGYTLGGTTMKYNTILTYPYPRLFWHQRVWPLSPTLSPTQLNPSAEYKKGEKNCLFCL